MCSQLIFSYMAYIGINYWELIIEMLLHNL